MLPYLAGSCLSQAAVGACARAAAVALASRQGHSLDARRLYSLWGKSPAPQQSLPKVRWDGNGVGSGFAGRLEGNFND